jgi:hypothetical protein
MNQALEPTLRGLVNRNISWLAFPAEVREQAARQALIKCVRYKDEGRQGPVHVVFNIEDRDEVFGVLSLAVRYKDGHRCEDGEVFAAWFTLAAARRIAKTLGVPLDE